MDNEMEPSENTGTFERWQGFSKYEKSDSCRRPEKHSAACSYLSTGTLGPASSIVSFNRKFNTFEDNVEKRYLPVSGQDELSHTKDNQDGYRSTINDYWIERERRHFPSLSNKPGETSAEIRCRRFIPHGYGDDFQYKPHAYHQQPKYTDFGLDWKSRIRYIPAPQTAETANNTEIWPDQWKGLRTYPWMSGRTKEEWAVHPDAHGNAKRCQFDGEHKASSLSTREVTHSMLYGKGKVVFERRNGLPQASPGDKSYQVVEYSPSFHKQGSTRPIVDFGGQGQVLADTFVPLQELPPIPRASYHQRERARQLYEESRDVENLDRWRAASPLQPPGHTHPLPIAKNDAPTIIVQD